MKFAHFEFDPEHDRLGEGPQSEVFRAVDTRLGRTVALKVLRPHVELDPAAAQRFDREAKHTSSLEHQNIATVYEYDKWRGTSYIAMEFLEGRTLDKIVKDGPISYEEGVRIGRQVTAALALVHERGLVHRDLKPANIILLQDGTAKLLDFGICRSGNESNITQSGMLVGTVLYMSPEQVRGEDVTPRTDVFALGAVLYHATTGALPFPGRSFPEVCMAILDGSPLRPSEQRSGYPRALEEFLFRCLARDPLERFASGAAAHGGLLSVAETMRLSVDVLKSASLKGRVLIPPLVVQDGSEHAQQFAGSLRRDLSSELSRSTQLRITLLEDGSLPDSEENGTYVMRARLDLAGPRGVLDYVIERASGPKLDQASELWRDRVEATDEDEWGLQAQIVGTVARTVKRRLADFALAPPTSSQRDPQVARTFSLRAHEVLHKGTTKHLLAAISSFRRAVEADPGCALAFAGLAECHVRKFLYWDGDASFLEEAEQYARRAMALDAACAEAHTSLGFACSIGGRRQDAQREYHLALQIDKDEWLAHRLLGALLARDGNHKEASPLLRRAFALRPDHIGSYDHLYEVLCRLDRYEEALEVADLGIQAARRHLAAAPDDQDARLHLALLLARMGSEGEALAEVARARALAPKDGFTAFHVACVHSLLGQVDLGLEALLEAQARGYFVQSELTRNTDLDALRGRPEFQELLA